eukprot:Gregarina_sp_Pseudo_9__5248@NODE_595_length_2527_cov_4_372186_g561_i0_p1_GENE_NODE_595_length_2527_cov_4_372186_g561_i0NODE_595_length_2527_cov_4_372186_g561_i0_p1_ORF_typecomplete_len798_score168_87Acyl_transf_3/PF01757_22/1_7e12Acyl_transf_3/PF01757_22/1_5e02_NODE_595_length_2527_cov_4_372186_g561_i01332310
MPADAFSVQLDASAASLAGANSARGPTSERLRSSNLHASWVIVNHSPRVLTATPVYAPTSVMALVPELSRRYILTADGFAGQREQMTISESRLEEVPDEAVRSQVALRLATPPPPGSPSPWTGSTRHSKLRHSKAGQEAGEEDEDASDCDLRIQESFDIRHNREYYDPLGAMYDSDATRAWHVDWMRFVANWLVVSVHFVRTVKEMHLQTSEGQLATLNAFLVNLLQIGMPIFFYASGRASGFSNDRSFWAYLRKKCLRLLVPLAAAYFTVLLPAALISGPFYESRDETMPSSTWSNVGASIKWWLKRFPIGCIEWLWYLPTLAGLGILTYPYCLWINTWHLCTAPDRLLGPRDREAKARLFAKYKLDPDNVMSLPYLHKLRLRPLLNTTLWLTLAGIIVTLICSFVYKGYRMRRGLMAVYSLSFLLPPFFLMFLLPWCRRWNWRTPLFALFPLATILFSFVKESTFSDLAEHGLTSTSWATVMAVPFYVAFYLQGHLEQRFMYEWEHYERMAMRSSSGTMTTSFIFRPFKVILWVALWANGCPGFAKEYGYMWAYPLYRKTYTTVSYVIASWVALHFWERFMAFYARTSISPSYHKHVINMSLIVYIFHGLHIAIIGRLVIWPFRENLTALGGILIFVVLVVPLTVVTYFLVINVPPLATVFGVGGGFKSWKWSNWGVPAKTGLQWCRDELRQRSRRYEDDLTSLDQSDGFDPNAQRSSGEKRL